MKNNLKENTRCEVCSAPTLELPLHLGEQVMHDDHVQIGEDRI
jgi:hypothetical protein